MQKQRTDDLLAPTAPEKALRTSKADLEWAGRKATCFS